MIGVFSFYSNEVIFINSERINLEEYKKFNLFYLNGTIEVYIKIDELEKEKRRYDYDEQ